MSNKSESARTHDRLLAALARFRPAKVAVVGDFVADEFIYGTTERISREAPVLILRFGSRALLPGGAGNAARNLAAMGARPVAFGVTGRDAAGEELRGSLVACGVDAAALVADDAVETCVKQRILSGGSSTTKQQVIRIDRGGDRDASPAARDELFGALAARLSDFDALLVSDYRAGLLDDAAARRLNDLVARHPAGESFVRVVDSRHHLANFPGFTLCTPNEEEAREATGLPVETDDQALAAADALVARTGCRMALLTRGSRGMALVGRGIEPVLVPITRRDEIADVTGAGDTVAAACVMALASGVAPREAVELANVAGGIKVRKRGTAVVTADEIAAEIRSLYG